MKKPIIGVVVLLSGCAHHSSMCPPGFVPARHVVTHQFACFQGTWNKVPVMWESPPSILVR